MVELRFEKGQRVRIKAHATAELIGVFGTIKKFAGCGGEYKRTPIWKVNVPSTDPNVPAEVECLDNQLEKII